MSQSVESLCVSDKGVAVLVEREGLRTEVYKDTVGVTIWVRRLHERRSDMVDTKFPVGSVGWVQTSLNTLGEHPPLKVDGEAGPLTKAALKVFELANGCKGDGVIGQQTTAALIKALPLPAP